MAQGGTIPTNRTQTVTFYNTTGIIEREKGIYLSPRFKGRFTDEGKEVRAVYLAILNATAVKDADYTDIALSSWSPEDRNLTVRGNIDDFRVITEEGDCLNYLVVTRTVTKNSTNYVYYYGFFITAVKQAGGSSISFTLEADDFTNVFWLHNKHVLTYYEVHTSDYEPYNERMKNCYVNRQHYDRVYPDLTGYWILDTRLSQIYDMSEQTIQVGQPIEVVFNSDGDDIHVSGTVEYIDDRDVESLHYISIKIKTDHYEEIESPTNYSSIYYNNVNYSCDYDVQDISWTHVVPIHQMKNTVFVNQEESFRFKYQYRDDRRPFSFSNVFTKDEMNAIKNTSAFSSLSTTLRKKIIKACIQYLVVEFKSNEKFVKTYALISGQSTPVASRTRLYANLIEGFNKFSPNCISPLINIPSIFAKFSSALNSFKFYAKLKNGTATAVGELTSASDVYKYLNGESLADFVFSAYVVNDVGMPDSFITDIDLSNHKIVFTVNNEINTDALGKDLYIVPVYNNRATTQQTLEKSIIYEYSSQADYSNLVANEWRLFMSAGYDTVFTMLMLSGYNSRTFALSFDDDDISNIKNKYYDPVLETEPYSFYSISYLSYEMPFNKNRYYETMSVNVEFYCSLNGAIKLYFVPEYTVESKSFKYYNDSLIFTLPSNMPLLSDSYATYYYQNQAQMKNQFAVNDYNRGVDLAQHFLISGPNSVGYSAGKGGMHGGGAGAGASAILETGNQLSQMTDEAIDWAQSNKNIEMNQKAKLADMGAKPDVVKQTGSDVFSDLMTRENRPYLNHYRIDELSYNSIAKILERVGYQVNLYTTLNATNRVGWNYIKLNSFDLNPAFDIMVGQEENLRKIFVQGVTLLHDKAYLTSGHNYESSLD